MSYFTLFVFVCVCWCSAHIVLCFCFVFLRLVCPMLPVSLDCTFFIVPSVFSSVYLFWYQINIISSILIFFTVQLPTMLAYTRPSFFRIE